MKNHQHLKKNIILTLAVIMVIGSTVLVHAYTTTFSGEDSAGYYSGVLDLTYDSGYASMSAEGYISNEERYTRLLGYVEEDASVGGQTYKLYDEGWGSSYDKQIKSGLRYASCDYFVDWGYVTSRNLSLW